MESRRDHPIRRRLVPDLLGARKTKTPEATLDENTHVAIERQGGQAR